MPEPEQESAPEPSNESIVIDGKDVNVPRAVVAQGRAAVHQWHTDREAPLVAEAATKAKIDLKSVEPTGHGKRHLLRDVGYAVLAREQADAEAKKLATTPEKESAK
jgi:pyruvate/2-oxoglutarate dehydrogenase complex dihydrolipoamide acyltransferase (E2) component